MRSAAPALLPIFRSRLQADILATLLLRPDQALTPHDYVGDKGFVGIGMITPFKKPLDITSGLAEGVMHTGYRRPVESFAETIPQRRLGVLQNRLNNLQCG